MIPEPRLALAHLTSTAFPTGAFAWSHGLELALREGIVQGPAALSDWLAVLLAQGAGRTDAILIGSAAACPDDPERLAALADLALALAPSAERRAETAEQGAAFAAAARAAYALDLPDLPYPVALGRAARLLSLPLRETAEHHLLALVIAQVQAAQRLMPLGQSAAHRIVAGLLPLIAAVAAETGSAGIDDIGSAAFGLDIASMRHECLQPRIFRS